MCHLASLSVFAWKLLFNALVFIQNTLCIICRFAIELRFMFVLHVSYGLSWLLCSVCAVCSECCKQLVDELIPNCLWCNCIQMFSMLKEWTSLRFGMTFAHVLFKIHACFLYMLSCLAWRFLCSVHDISVHNSLLRSLHFIYTVYSSLQFLVVSCCSKIPLAGTLDGQGGGRSQSRSRSWSPGRTQGYSHWVV